MSEQIRVTLSKQSKILIALVTASSISPAIWFGTFSVPLGIMMVVFLMVAWLAGWLYGRDQMIDMYDSWQEQGSHGTFEGFRNDK